jgi:preprotein translocase subunit SecA
LSAKADGPHELEMYQTALDFSRRLQVGQDYQFNERERRIELSKAGKAWLVEHAGQRPGVWTSLRARHELVTQALSAMVLFQRAKQYVVTNGKVHIVDEFTGRIMTDRSWERGLHQMIEAKESCDLSPHQKPIARITYQRLISQVPSARRDDWNGARSGA